LETLEPSKSDFDVTSVLGPLWFPPAGAYLVYYVGDWVTPDGDGIRLARSTDGVVFEHVVTENVLDVGDVDPNPVRDEGGGIRLYHTGGRPGGGPSVASSDDGLAFEDHGPLVDFDASACDLGASERLCLLDPGFLRLPDDRLVLYFSEMRDTGDTLDFAIRRAFATD
jgi:hypothetical protein